MRIAKVCVCAASLVFASAGCSATLEFNSGPGIVGGDSSGFERQGYRFTFDDSGSTGGNVWSIGTDTLSWCPGCSMSFARSDGVAFAFDGFSAFYFPIPYTFEITGVRADGGTVSSTVLVEAFAGATERTTVDFGSEWSSLVRVDFATVELTPSIIDSIRVTAVPLPAAAWLFATGLAGLAALRRSRGWLK